MAVGRNKIKKTAKILVYVWCSMNLGTTYCVANSEMVDIASIMNASKSVTFDTKEEAMSFIEFYSLQYELVNIQNRYMTWVSENGYRVSQESPNDLTREDCEVVILENYPVPTGETPVDIVNNACNSIRDMKYDLAYLETDLITSITDKSGVCWHFTRIVAYLSRAAGADVTIVYGTAGTVDWNRHLWLEYQYNGRTIVCDPTGYVTSGGNTAWLDISVDTYARNYREMSYLNVH